MRNYLIVISLITVFLALEAQPITLTELDSISTVVVTDSLQLEEPVISVSLEELEQELMTFIRNRKQSREDLILPALSYQENFHYAALFDPLLIFTKNSFSLLPYKVKNIHILQNFQPLLLTERSASMISFQQENYDLQIPLTESFLALGDNNMNHAGIWFAKGNILNIRDLNLEASYLGQEGNWLGVNETSRNFNFHLFRQFTVGEIHLNSTIIDQKIPAVKTNSADTIGNSTKEKFTDLDLSFLNKYIDLGLRYEEWTIEAEKRRTRALRLTKDLSWRSHFLTLQYEFQQQEQAAETETFYLFSLQHDSELWDSRLTNDLRYVGKDDLYLNSNLLLKTINQFFLKADYEKLEFTKTGYPAQRDKTGFGLAYSKNRSSSELVAGEIKETLNYTFNQELFEAEIKHQYLEFLNRLNLQTGRFRIILKNYLHYNLDHASGQLNTASFIPGWQSKMSVEFSYDLQHNNAINLGFIHTYYSEFYDITDQMMISENNLYDLYLVLQVSEFFRIKLDLINVTDEKDFPSVIDLPKGTENYNYGTHLNISVNWIFVN